MTLTSILISFLGDNNEASSSYLFIQSSLHARNENIIVIHKHSYTGYRILIQISSQSIMKHHENVHEKSENMVVAHRLRSKYAMHTHSSCVHTYRTCTCVYMHTCMSALRWWPKLRGDDKQVTFYHRNGSHIRIACPYVHTWTCVGLHRGHGLLLLPGTQLLAREDESGSMVDYL